MNNFSFGLFLTESYLIISEDLEYSPRFVWNTVTILVMVLFFFVLSQPLVTIYFHLSVSLNLLEMLFHVVFKRIVNS